MDNRTKGGISFPSLTVGRCRRLSEPAVAQTIKVESLAPLAAQLDHFIAVIRGEEDPLITAEDATNSLALTYRIQQILASQSANSPTI